MQAQGSPRVPMEVLQDEFSGEQGGAARAGLPAICLSRGSPCLPAFPAWPLLNPHPAPLPPRCCSHAHRLVRSGARQVGRPLASRVPALLSPSLPGGSPLSNRGAAPPLRQHCSALNGPISRRCSPGRATPVQVDAACPSEPSSTPHIANPDVTPQAFVLFRALDFVASAIFALSCPVLFCCPSPVACAPRRAPVKTANAVPPATATLL